MYEMKVHVVQLTFGDKGDQVGRPTKKFMTVHSVKRNFPVIHKTFKFVLNCQIVSFVSDQSIQTKNEWDWLTDDVRCN